MLENESIVEVKDLSKFYKLPKESLLKNAEIIKAVDNISFKITKGKSFGVVGESGSGKSTLARCIMGLEKPSSGSVKINGIDIFSLGAKELRNMRKQFQMVFQDPFGSLNPRKKVLSIVAEPLDVLEKIKNNDRKLRVINTLTSVGLKESDIEKFPHEFSGGQRQRIAIARALITKPQIIVADEPVSALDVSVQAQVLNLLQDLQDSFGVTYILISHDLAVVKFVCDDVIVMNEGKIVEFGTTREIFSNPKHEYTKTLLNAVPKF
ncbi:ATP-binding cassette domain-containing protein [Alphaproteobacteria bacterium]|nr:ATP-binding cassette domain-containing protein [Alphaproteobacteria bacterium]